MLRRLFGSQQPPDPAASRPAAPSEARSADRWPLDTPLLAFQGDAWTIRDACEGVQIFGAIGSGKTSGSGAALARAFLDHGFGGLVLCAKPEERRLWERAAAAAGRSASLCVVAPDGPWRFNFLDYELKRPGRGGGQSENLVNLLVAVMELVEGKQGMAGTVDFWERSGRQLLRSAIDLLALSGRRFTLDLLGRFIAAAPQRPGLVDDPAWAANSLYLEVMGEASLNAQTPRQQHDFEVSSAYWDEEYPNLGDRTRSSVVITVTSAISILQHGLAWELLGQDTTIVPEATYKDGAILVLDLPVQEFGEVGRVVQGIVKYCFQRSILRRDAEADPRPVFLWADEAQNFISGFDYEYQAVARSARACTVYLTQNLSSYYAKLGAHGQDQANSLLGNFVTKIFHANSDQPTNQYAADLIGQHRTTNYNFGSSQQESGESRSAGGSQSVQYKLLPSTFTTLRKGGPANRRQVDAVIFQGGRIWRASGDTYLRATFEQHG